MLSLFRINDLSRIIILALVLVIIRLPFWISGVPITLTDFQYRVMAEALSGDRLIYSEVWHYVGPLSALIIQWIGELFGKSFLAFQILGYLLLFFQAIYFNSILNRLDAMKERTLIPALFYIFFGSLFVEQFAFGPELLAMFPLLYAIDIILSQIRFGAESEQFFKIGFIFSLAVLCHGPFFWLLPFFLIYFPFAFVMNGRRFGLVISGFLFPVLVAILYFYFRSGLQDFSSQYLIQILLPFQNNYLDLQQYILFFTIPIILFLVAAFQAVFRSKFLNYQVSFVNFFLLLFLVSGATVYFSAELSLRSFYLYFPILAFLSAQLFLSLKRRGINELIFSALLILTVFVNYGFAYTTFFNPSVVNLDKIILKAPAEQREMKVTVASQNLGYWFDNDYSGPFLCGFYTKHFFEGEMTEAKLVRLHDLITKEKPDVIIDTENHFRPVLRRNYLMSQDYRKSREGNLIRRD